jgi:hypothetical protein
MTTLEERLIRLEARAAIEDLVVAYFLAADADDDLGVGASFTEDAEFRSSGVLNATGSQGIVDFIRQAREQMGLTIHTPHYTQVTFKSTVDAHGLVGAHLELVLGDTSVYGAVRYADHYVQREGRWLIRSRDMRTIFLAAWGDVGKALSSQTPVRWPGAAPARSDFPRKDRAAMIAQTPHQAPHTPT